MWVWLAGFGCVFAFYAEETRRRRLAGWRYRPLFRAKAWAGGVVAAIVVAVLWTALRVGQWAGSRWDLFGGA